YIIGTFLIEPLMNILGRFDIASAHRSYFPSISLLSSCRYLKGGSTVAYSPTQARSFILIVACIFHALFFTIIGTSRNFGQALIAFAFSTFARSFFTGRNAYVNAHPKVSLGQLHGCWALGSLLSPLVCQTLLSRGVLWRHFYLGSLALAGLNTIFVVFAYYPTKNEFRIDRETALSESITLPNPIVVQIGSRSSVVKAKGEHSIRQALSNSRVWAFAFFQSLYAGSETVTQGFVSHKVSYAANPNTVGYVDSGFWAGEAITRIGFGFFYLRETVTQGFVSHKTAVVALLLHILVWVIPSVLANGIFTAAIGLAYGPVFPLGVALATRMLPKEIHMTSMAIISTVANMGNAVFPLVTGILSNKIGVNSYNYILVAQGITLVVVWAFLPTARKQERSN
ncbi:hypothetical protein M422DRAFT_166506, partial [Sphaerobolus stellatus SS14]